MVAEQLTNTLGINFSNLFKGISTAGYALFYIILIAAAITFFYILIIRPLTYKIKVVIWAARGGTGMVEAQDKAKIIRGGFFRKSPVAKLKLLKRKLTLPVPEISHFVRSEKGDTIYYYKYGDTDYVPVIFSELTEKFKDLALNPSEEDMKLWWLSENKALLLRNQTADFLTKYAPMLMMGALIILIIIVTWIIAGTLKEYIGAVGAVGSNLKEVAASLAQAHSATVPTPTGT